MSNFVEKIGKTVDEAVKMALQELNTTEENVEIEVLDTAGEEDYQNLRDSWINYAEGFILAYAINDKKSFDYLDELYNRIVSMKGMSCAIVIAGNKSDLIDDFTTCDVEQKDWEW